MPRFFNAPHARKGRPQFHLSDTQKVVIEDYFSHVQEYFLGPLLKKLSSGAQEQFAAKFTHAFYDIKEDDELASFIAELFPGDDLAFLREPAMSLLSLMRGRFFAEHALFAALDPRLFDAQNARASQSDLKVAVGQHLSVLVFKYMGSHVDDVPEPESKMMRLGSDE